MIRKICFAALLASITSAQSQSLLDHTNTIVAPAAPSAVTDSFTVTVAGTYELTLTDAGVPAPLTGERAAILRDGAIVRQIELADTAATGSVTFEATPGNYSISIVGTPGAAGVGTIGARIRRGTDAPLLDLARAVALPNPPAPSTQRELDTTFEIAQAGDYRVTLTDAGFPAALGVARLTIVREGATGVAAMLAAPGSATFTATAGTYRLFAQLAAGSSAGLFNVAVRNIATDALAYRETGTVGKVAKSAPLALIAGVHTLTAADVGFPAALTGLHLAVLSGGELVARLDAPGTVDFTAVAGLHEILQVADPATGNSGTFAVTLARGSATLADFTTAASEGDAAGAVSLVGSVGTAGAHRLRLTDFAFPQAFTNLRARIVQNGTTVASLNAPGTIDADLAVGTVTVLVSGVANTSSNGIFGVELRSVGSTGAAVIEATRGVGTAFDSWPFAVSTAGRYQVFAEDLEFPARFAGFDAVITRGPDVIGSFFGGGSFVFSATPGTYFINLIARPAATSGGAGTYRMRVANAPSVPTVTLTADSTNVTTGGTARITWSSTNATACTASGAWSGAKAASGSETSVALSTASTFNIECTGPGGASTAQLLVNVSAPAAGGSGGGGKGGGGALDQLLIAFLLGVAALRVIAKP